MERETQSNSNDQVFSDPIVIVNVGIRTFYDSLRDSGIEVYQVDWNMPAGGDQDLLRLLDLLHE
jgi:hypothetical protein